MSLTTIERVALADDKRVQEHFPPSIRPRLRESYILQQAAERVSRGECPGETLAWDIVHQLLNQVEALRKTEVYPNAIRSGV